MRYLKRFMVVMLVAAMILGTAGIASATLNDVVGTRFEESVGYLEDLGVVAGYPDGTFLPEATITRAEAVKIVIMMKYGSDTLAKLLKGAVSFSDVPGDHWASGFIALAKNAGIVDGFPDGTFKPSDPVTYAQFAKMQVEAAGLSPVAGLDWPSNYVAAAQAAGMLASVPDFVANEPSIRGDCAIMAAYTVQEVKNPDTGKTLAQSVFGQSAAATIEVTPLTASVALGGSVQFSAVVKDAAGNALEETVAWSAVGGVVSAAGLFTATTTGAGTVTATVGQATAVVSVSVFGTASKLGLSVSNQIVANGKSKATVTIAVQDASGNTVGNYAGTVSVLSTNPASVKLAASSVAVTGGVGAVEISSAAAGVTAASVISATTATGLTGATLTVTPVAQTLTSVVLSVDPAMLAADNMSKASITATCKDQEGQSMVAPGGLTVKATLSATDAVVFTGATAGYRDITTFGTAIADALQAKNIIGSAGITGVVTAPTAQTGVPVSGTSIATTIIGAPYKLAIDPVTSVTAGAPQTIKVRVLDVNGNQITRMPTGAATVNLKVGTVHTTGSPATVALDANGIAAFTYSTTTAKTVTYDATGTWNAATLVGASATGTFNVGSASVIALTASPATLNANGVATSTLTATVKDANANKVTAGSYPIKFSKTTNNNATQAFADTTISTVDGVASVVVTATTNVGPTDTFTASSSGLTSGTATVTTALIGAPNKMEFQAVTNKVVGETMTVKVEVKDFGGVLVTSDNGRVVTLTAKDSAGTVVGTYEASTASGIASFSVSYTKIDTYTFSAASAGLSLVATTTGDFTVGSLSALSLKSDLYTIGNGGHVALLTIGGADSYGNALATWSATDITLSAATTYGALGATTFVGTTAPVTTTFTSNANVGSTVITASAGGLTSVSITVTTLVVGVPSQLRVESTTDAVANDAAEQSVKVTILDAAGNRVTNSVLEITLANTGSAVITSADANGAEPGIQVVAAKGQATFKVKNAVAQTVTYTATATGVTQATGTGTFYVGSISKLVIAAPVPQYIKGDGSAIATYQIKVTDAQGNTIPAAAGTVTFKIDSGNDYATVLTPTVTIVSGVGTAMVQAKTTPTVQNAITVSASTTDIKKPDGNAATAATNTQLLVDGKVPTVVTPLGAQIAAAGGTGNVVFSELLDAASKTAVQSAITAATAKGTLAYAWNDVTFTLTITNSHATDDTEFAVGTVAVNITDMAGNQTTGAGVVVIP